MQETYRRLLIILACFATQTIFADEPASAGTSLVEYLESVRTQGLVIIYSSDLVSDKMIVTEQPDLADVRSALPDILRPFGLTVIDGPMESLLIVETTTPAVAAAPLKPESDIPLPEIVVTSSLHQVQNAESGTHTYLERELATRIPAAAEEAVRLTNRLPGTASGGISSRNHIRGGEVNEVLFLFDGLRLYEPYHMKDFQSLASIVNGSAIAGVNFYSGAYPARYGDRMSGVMSMDMRRPTKRTETELSLSFFNASALSMGSLGARHQGDWLVAARRGNLDLIVDVIDPDFGSPDYNDLLLHVGWDFGPLAEISVNALASYDKISLIDASVGETANAKYQNRVFWLKWGAEWSGLLNSETIVSFNEIGDERRGVLDLPGIVSGTLSESRDFTAFEIQQDWRFAPSARWMLSFGIRARDQDADYVHVSARTITPPFDQALDNEPFASRDLQLSPDGAQYAAYSELRWRPVDSLVLDLGVRWDQQTYTSSDDDRQYSPRASVLWSFNDATEVRLGFGEYYQAQEINELQVSDGLTEFFPAQRAQHVVANIKHQFDVGIDLDVSFFRKTFRTLRPRFENVFNTLTLLPELQFDRIRIDAFRAESRGVELTASFGSGSDNLFWWLGYAWSEVEDSVSTGKVKRSWDQTHTVKGGVSWRWGAWDISAAGEVHTGWPKTELGTVRNDSRYSVFHTVDARISRDFTVKRGELTAFLEVTNLYNRANPCCTEYSLQPTTSGPDELVAREAHWLPVVPSLGVVWRF